MVQTERLTESGRPQELFLISNWFRVYLFIFCFDSHWATKVRRTGATTRAILSQRRLLSCIYEDGFVRLNETACGRIILSTNKEKILESEADEQKSRADIVFVLCVCVSSTVRISHGTISSSLSLTCLSTRVAQQKLENAISARMAVIDVLLASRCYLLLVYFYAMFDIMSMMPWA